ncbi:MAG: hypothetical protein ACOYJF_10605 [Prevotella sp.]|jgi:hypothetical protein
MRHILYKSIRFLSVSVLQVVLVFLFILATTFSSCRHEDTDEVESLVDTFSTAYFNWQFFLLQPYVTDDSQPCLRYLSSQINQNDIDTLRALPEGAKVEVNAIDYFDRADSATATVSVKHYLKMNQLGKVGTLTEASVYRIPLKKYDGKWKVSLIEPLREVKVED